MRDKVAALIMLTIVLVFLILLLVNNIRAQQTERAWFTAGAMVVIIIAWVLHFVRNF